MQDRLAELRQQRVLIAEHLAWLDREIATVSSAAPAAGVPAESITIGASGSAVPTVPTQPAPTPTPTPAESPAASSLSLHTPKQMVMLGGKLVAIRPELPQLPEHEPAEIKQDVRRGCLLYFALAGLLVVLGGALLVWASQAYKVKHPPAPRTEIQESR